MEDTRHYRLDDINDPDFAQALREGKELVITDGDQELGSFKPTDRPASVTADQLPAPVTIEDFYGVEQKRSLGNKLKPGILDHGFWDPMPDDFMEHFR